MPRNIRPNYTPRALGGLAASVWLLLPMIAFSADAPPRAAIPACAWARRLGDIPANPISCSPNRGVALGGFGAGSFMYNISGSFGPWELKPCDMRFEQFWNALPQAAFHYYEQPDGASQIVVKCLSTDTNLMPAWDRLKPSATTYYALQPKGWVVYDGFAAQPRLKFFSPIIAHNYRETAYPAAVFEYELDNPTDTPLTAALMLTWPQVPYSTAPRTGYRCAWKTNGAIAGIVLKAVDPANSAETQNSEWCIATLKTDGRDEVSAALSWNGAGDGRDIWNDFAADGRLGNQALDSSMSAAALAVTVRLPPGARRRIPFAITWDIPVVEFSSGTQWWRKYTEYLGRDADNAFPLAVEALIQRVRWEAAVDAWMAPFVNSPRLPEWLKRAAFNELYYNQFGGVFYEAGLKAGHPHEFMGRHEDDHKHFVMESPIYRSANTLDVRHYSSIVFARFWPEIERDTLRCYGDGALFYQFDKPVPSGLLPHDVGDPTQCDPYFVFDVYRHDKPELPYWKDLNPKYLQQVWRYYHLHGDREFLDYAWPACKAAYEFMKTTDTDGDGLPNNFKSDNTYDDWGLFGTSLLCGGLWVGGLQAMERMAEIQGDPILTDIRDWLAKARTNLDAQLWYEAGQYYRMDTESEHPTAIMADGLNGQRYSETCGLGDILPADRMKAHLRKVYELCVKPMRDYTGDGIGDIGAINGVKEDGSLLGALQSDEVWSGSSYFLASLMYRAGLTNEALQTAWGVYYITYEEPSTAFWFNTPESWRVPTMTPRPARPEQYQRPRAVWELVLEIMRD